MRVGVSSLDNCKTAGNIIFCADKYDGRGLHVLTPDECRSYCAYLNNNNYILIY